MRFPAPPTRAARRLLVPLLLLALAASADAQRKPRVPPPGEPAPAPPPPSAPAPQAPTDTAAYRTAVTIRAGMALPLSHHSLDEYWNGGIAGSAGFSVAVSRAIWLGLALDLGLLPFDDGAFAAANPDVPPKAVDVGWGAVAVTLRADLAPGESVAPYCAASLGVFRAGRAQYQVIVQERRVTYYDIPGATRMTVSAGAGLLVRFSPHLALDAAANLRYIHNDPDVGLLADLGAGLTIFF